MSNRVAAHTLTPVSTPPQPTPDRADGPDAEDGAAAHPAKAHTSGRFAALRRLNPRGRDGSRWRLATPAVIALSGVLFAVSAVNSEGNDLRPGSNTDLPSLVQSENDQLEHTRARAAELRSEIDELTSSNPDAAVKQAQRQVEGVKAPAGLTAVRGEGVRVVLSDAPDEAIEAYVDADEDNDANDLLVHQQDIQAVANAMWRGGADAVTIQGQRIITTTGIKCAGSTVQLQGLSYPAPYTIEAVGDVDRILAEINSDPYLSVFREYADPTNGLGWEMTTEESLVASAYRDVPSLHYAEPIRDPSD